MAAAAPVAAGLSLPAARAVDCISDLHLHPGVPDAMARLAAFLSETTADAVCILGDLFEVWVGDDALDAADSFEAQCAGLLRASVRPVYVMHGNRDFLLSTRFAADAGCTLMADPTLLGVGTSRWLLTHGDALCLADTAYLAFRAQVRAEAWQRAFLAQPLGTRREVATGLRAQSAAAQHNLRGAHADVDPSAAVAWLSAADASTLVHGHTHRPAMLPLGAGRVRYALSDWDLQARPARADALRLHADGRAERIDLAH